MALPRVDWGARLASDWRALSVSAADAAGVDPAELLAALPVPSAGELAAAGAAIEAIEGLLDGKITPQVVAKVESLVGAATGALVAGTAIGSAVPGLGNVAGAVAGMVVGKVIDAFFGAAERAKRDRVLREARADTRAAVGQWERDQVFAAWTSTLAAVSRDTPSGDYAYAVIERYRRNEETGADRAAALPFIVHALKTLEGWNWAPKGGRFSRPKYSLAWVDEAWAQPFPSKLGTYAQRGSSSQKRTLYERKPGIWTPAPISVQERFDAWSTRMKARVDHNAEVVARWNAYTVQLAAMRSAIDQAIASGKVKRKPFAGVSPALRGVTFVTKTQSSGGGAAKAVAAAGGIWLLLRLLG